MSRNSASIAIRHAVTSNTLRKPRSGNRKSGSSANAPKSVLAAAKAESILLVGDPGAGKSAVISAAAAQLRNEGKEVIELAVDRLPVETVEGLQLQLGLTHRLLDVLENWPGNEPAYLFVDALDATRGGRGEGLFRWLISEVLKLPGERWRIVASIRSFDLRMGQQLAELFVGIPPDANYADKVFSAVKHVHIPIWENSELEELLARAEPIAMAVRSVAIDYSTWLAPLSTHAFSPIVYRRLAPGCLCSR